MHFFLLTIVKNSIKVKFISNHFFKEPVRVFLKTIEIKV